MAAAEVIVTPGERVAEVRGARCGNFASRLNTGRFSCVDPGSKLTRHERRPAGRALELTGVRCKKRTPCLEVE
jgi:hypothetical protein